VPFHPTRSLITGASSGIGAEFARSLAARGSDLVLVARRVDRLQALADELTAAHGIHVDVLGADLAEAGAGTALREQVEGPIDFLVNNAGFGIYGHLARADVNDLDRMIAVDIRALVDATRAFLPGMIENGTGGILNFASTAGYQPLPGMATYGAAKAFVLSFTEAVWKEAEPHGVKVMALSPGATESEFFDVVGTENAAVGAKQTAKQVVATGLAALDRRSTPPSVISGGRNAFTAVATRFAPKRFVVNSAARLMRA
jgi:short-subunit dehydrogenase